MMSDGNSGSVDVTALANLNSGEELTFQMDHETTGQSRQYTGIVEDHPYMDCHEDWMVSLTDVKRADTPGYSATQRGSTIIKADGTVESRPCASRQIHTGDITAVVTPVTTADGDAEDSEPADTDASGDSPEVMTDGGEYSDDCPEPVTDGGRSGRSEVALRCDSSVDCDWKSGWYGSAGEAIQAEGENGLLDCPECGRQSFKSTTRWVTGGASGEDTAPNAGVGGRGDGDE